MHFFFFSFTGASCPKADIRKLKWTLNGKRVSASLSDGQVKVPMASWKDRNTVDLCVHVPGKCRGKHQQTITAFSNSNLFFFSGTFCDRQQ